MAIERSWSAKLTEIETRKKRRVSDYNNEVPYLVQVYHYTKITVVRSTATQNVLFLCKATAGRYIGEPIRIQQAMALALDYRKRFYKVWYKRDHEVGLLVSTKRLPKSLAQERDCP